MICGPKRTNHGQRGEVRQSSFQEVPTRYGNSERAREPDCTGRYEDLELFFEADYGWNVVCNAWYGYLIC